MPDQSLFNIVQMLEDKIANTTTTATTLYCRSQPVQQQQNDQHIIINTTATFICRSQLAPKPPNNQHILCDKKPIQKDQIRPTFISPTKVISTRQTH